MKAILLSLKSRSSGPVIKMWQAVAHVSVRRHAPCLAMFFNHRVETLQPTQGSLSAEDEQSENSSIKILHLFFLPTVSTRTLKAAVGASAPNFPHATPL